MKDFVESKYFESFDLITCNPPYFKYKEDSLINDNIVVSVKYPNPCNSLIKVPTKDVYTGALENEEYYFIIDSDYMIINRKTKGAKK
mgnify:CR=1 FL=1